MPKVSNYFEIQVKMFKKTLVILTIFVLILTINAKKEKSEKKEKSGDSKPKVGERLDAKCQ